MFREKLHKDLDGISPDEELLVRVSEMMREEAAKPKPKIHITVMKYAGMAAALCLVATGWYVVVNGISGGIRTANEAATADYGMAAQDTAAGDALSGGMAAADAESGEIYDEMTEIYFADKAVAEETYAATSIAEAKPEEPKGLETTRPATEPKTQTTPPETFSSEPVVTTAQIIYKNKSYTLSDSEIAQIADLAESFLASGNTPVSKVLSDEETDAFGKNGLKILLGYSDGSSIGIYADKNIAYLCGGGSTYQLSTDIHLEILAYAEYEKLKRMFF